MHPILDHIIVFANFVKNLRTPLIESFLEKNQDRSMTLGMNDHRLQLDYHFLIGAPSGHEAIALRRHIDDIMTDEKHEEISFHLGMIYRYIFDPDNLEAEICQDFQFSIFKKKDLDPAFILSMPGHFLKNPILENSLMTDNIEDMARNLLILATLSHRKNHPQWWVRFEKFSVKIHAKTPHEAAMLCLIFYPQKYEKCIPTNIAEDDLRPVDWENKLVLDVMDSAKDIITNALK